MNNKPIGIFDSGVGGLTVLRALLKNLPNENFIYFGDTARVPYGTKSAETVRRYSKEIVRFLKSCDIKFLVVACNTASSVAIAQIKSASEVPTIGVIEPGVKSALSVTRTKRIAVIGTQATIASKSYEKALKRKDKSVKVFALACPLFVPIAEEGLGESDIARITATRYLARLKQRRADTLILGCTHYPLLKATISDVMGKKTAIVDSASAVAEEVATAIKKFGLSASPTNRAKIIYYVSDDTVRFYKVAKRFLGEPAKRVKRIFL